MRGDREEDERLNLGHYLGQEDEEGLSLRLRWSGQPGGRQDKERVVHG